MRHWINVGTGCVGNTTSPSVLEGGVSGSSGQVAERACVESEYYLYDIVNM
jgi:hypothetical protein